MRTQDRLRQECQKVCARRYKELGLSEPAKVKDLLPQDYVLSEDKEELVELLTYSLGLSKLWMEYCQANPNRQPADVNKVILRYMINMWGQDWFPSPPTGQGTKTTGASTEATVGATTGSSGV